MQNTASRRAFLVCGIAAPALGGTQGSAAPLPRYRTLGRTGLKVTELGFGSEAVSDSSVFHRAIDAGINFFDTARSYEGGNAERALGSAIKGRRERVVIASRSYAKSAAQFRTDIDLSLRELGVEAVDIFYLGQRDTPDAIAPELVDILRSSQKAGKTRFIGVSTHRLGNVVEKILEHRFDVVQIPYSFATGTKRDPFNHDATNLGPALDRLKQAGVGVVAMKVMAGGYRFGNFRDPNADVHARAGAHAAAIRWALRDSRIHTTSVRMTDMEQLEENLAAMSRPWSDADSQLLAGYVDRFGPALCRMCGACDGRCPKGLHVSDAVRSVMYADGYGDVRKGRACWRRAAGTVRCTSCTSCAVTCPNGVAVRRQLLRAESLFA